MSSIAEKKIRKAQNKNNLERIFISFHSKSKKQRDTHSPKRMNFVVKKNEILWFCVNFHYYRSFSQHIFYQRFSRLKRKNDATFIKIFWVNDVYIFSTFQINVCLYV